MCVYVSVCVNGKEYELGDTSIMLTSWVFPVWILPESIWVCLLLTLFFPVWGRLKSFKVALLDVFREAHAQSVGMNRLTESINQNKEDPFSSEEIQAALSRMQDDNQVMVSDGIIFLIWGDASLNLALLFSYTSPTPVFAFIL